MTLMDGKNFFLKNLENTYNNKEIIYYYKLILSEVFKRNELQLALDPKSSLKNSEFTFLKQAVKNLLAQKPILSCFFELNVAQFIFYFKFSYFVYLE